MAEEPTDPEDEFRELLAQFLSGQAPFDPAALAGVAGLPTDPAVLSALIAQLQGALARGGSGGIDWSLAGQQAGLLAREGMTGIDDDSPGYGRAAALAALWLGESTGLPGPSRELRAISRAEWAERTLPVWSEVAEPVATSIADALTRVMREQLPEELGASLPDPGGLMRSIGGVLFAMQLGQVVGRLSHEVLSGGDIGIALTDAEEPVLLPQNVRAFAEGLDDVDPEQVLLYLSIRELAHATLFRHAKWLRLHLLTQLTDFARGIEIDAGRLEELAERITPGDTEQLRELLVSGRLIPPRTAQQEAALGRIETMLALVDGWVDVVTESAAARLPRAAAIAEMVTRRRAVGGPAEHAFGTLIGLELRPRRLREAAALWRRLGDELGAEARDGLWAHPDLLPVAEDIDDPTALIARLGGGADAELDELDQAIEALLDGEPPQEP